VLRAAALLLAAAALAAPGAGAANAPAKKKVKTTHTAAGMAAAARAVLGAADLGPGWTAGKAGAADASLECGSAAPPKGIVETGKAVSPTFSESSSGPFVSQAVFVYASAPEAQQVWQQTAGKAALACLARSVAGGSSKGIRFTVLHEQTLARPAVGDRSAAYRVVARVHATAQTIPAYVDLVLVGRGDALTEISYSAFSTPVGRAVELAVAQALARRL
jgi:hypothetical protein